MNPLRVAGIVLSASLIVSTTGCQRNEPAAQPVSTASEAAAPAAQGTHTSNVDPIVEAALSADAERGGVVGAPLDPRTLTSRELQFGRSPKPDPSVTYQPGVVVMEHGDSALRSMESNGMIWHFDPNAPQVDQIQPGAIIFATERCVGRVLQVQRGSDVAVLLGPVQITDVIQKAHFVYDQPLDLNSVVAVPAPDFPVTFQQDAFQKPRSSPSPSESPSNAPAVETTSAVTRHYRLESVTYAVVTKVGRMEAVSHRNLRSER
jgi:hypothetical protein